MRHHSTEDDFLLWFHMITVFWKRFTTINAIAPTLAVVIFRLVNLPIYTQRMLAYTVIVLIFGANIVLWRRYGDKRKIISAIIALNIFALFFAGNVSFFTAIPNLPFYFKSWMWVIGETT